ncbi:uncharacterized protein LOC133850589 isoform X1 [Drosophila sulfurigaster albostrigata]|uniref:uncharacterized protein LOC133850589 isoform X1 n=1 Tax=Drosophila sulfurigaster albostrigata TaxID=89887 RepID=UPI002D21A8F0|nr:uncharacterized protein LOC133850589 isoform X1 [Drosophila sulfurigaster albostrigata]
MKIRLHLVRFMYINLILSCCFWLYDNAAAAADEFTVNAAAAENAAGVLAPETGKQGIRSSGDEKVPNALNDYKKSNEVASEQQTATTTTVPQTSTATTTRQEAADADSDIMLKLGTQPRTSAKTKTNSKVANAVKDTSVNLNVVLPSSVNINNNEDVVISVVPRSSEKTTNTNTNANINNDNANENAKVNANEAAVPKSQLNNEINHNNIYTNTQPDVIQLEQSQQSEFSGDNVMIPKTQKQQQQQESFSDIITELPSVTITELPLQLEPVKESLDAVMLQEPSPGASNKTAKEQLEQPAVAAKQMPQKDEINDPGGGSAFEGISTTTEANATVDANVTTASPETESMSETSSTASSNETVEEVPMPVFSEWAQKQMEAEASREQAMELEQQVVNNSAQRKNATGAGNGKLPSLKLRSKNYASPDCGAKIIASNGDATNTGAVLSHSSDEYMLSTCGSRIWFVVELCEAVQAQKVELANFELFSSSPKNFTVAVSKRFPTRDWSNVGRFTAEDKRTVQTFELQPYLFGKFVRVDIHSHYSKEHFCPVSLFRVFGTSEYEAFETEIRPSDELDDFDDDFAGQEQAHKTGNGNIFQSASDAVMQMVKKAAQVLVKPTKALRWSSDPQLCHTPSTGSYSCASCNSTIVERINQLLSCQSQQLQLLLALPQLRTQMLQTRVCQADFDISLGALSSATSGMDKRQSFYLSLLPAEHVGAMCKLLQGEFNSSLASSPLQPLQQLELKRQQQQHLDVVEQHTENITAPDAAVESVAEVIASMPGETLPEIASSSEKSTAQAPATTEPAAATPHADAQPADATPVAPTPADVNIFNVPSDTQEAATPNAPASVTSYAETAAQQQQLNTPSTPADINDGVENVIQPPPSTAATPTTSAREATTESHVNGDLLGSGNGMDDSHLTNWENIDSLLTTTVASITAGGGAAAAAAAVVNGNANLAAGAGNANAAGSAVGGGVNLQPKLTNGAQSESVFIRLSNRIKALERNMSLSGQYLEELSRRYKKQVEELQQTLTQQTLTVRTLEDQSRRYIEQEQLYQQQSAELAGEVRALTYQVQACILVVIIVGTCIFLMLVLGIVYYRKLRRQTQQLQPQASPTTVVKQNLSRRKSYEQIGEHSPGGKRRPSEEAMIILNGCGDIALMEPNGVTRQRKISVCYGSNNNIAASMFNNARASLHRRKGVKHNSLDSAQLASTEQTEKFFDVETLKSSKPLPTKAAKKKSLQELKRQESAPANFTQGGGAGQAEESTQSDFDESLILDDDDLCNFIPNSDLAYNEFMPDGPSGYHIVDTVDGKTDSKLPQGTAKKSRRVSSPAFFKSPFSKSKNKGATFNGIGGVKGSHSAHEATSWEWYRLKRNEKHAKQLTVPSVSVSANASLDSSSLSEINFPYNNSNSTSHNSFRILEETILNADAERRGPINGKTSSSSSGSGSGASISSSTTKKKPRVLNNIFRKVF